jgi:hypothetical protein
VRPKTSLSRRHWLYLLLAAIMAVVAAGGWVYWLEVRPGITRQNAARIQDGMTIAEVEALLGGPAGDYQTPGRPHTTYMYHYAHPVGSVEKKWIGDEGLAIVAFDSEGRVVVHLYIDAADYSMHARLRRWIGL